MHRNRVIACTALALTACQSPKFTGSALLIEEVTTAPNDLTLTLRVGARVTLTGMRIDTVGDNTVVTQLRDGGARRFILAGLVGYRGRISLNTVDLVLGETTVWIDEHCVKMHGPDGSIDVRLRDDSGVDRFDDRDLVVAGDKVEPASPRR